LGGRGKSFLDADAAAVAAAAGTLVSALGTISISPSAPSRFDWEGRGGRDPTPSHTTPPAVMPASLTRERRPIVLSPYVEKKMVRPVSSFGQSDLVQVIFRFLQIWMSHVTRMNASCHTYGVISLIWMSRLTLLNESCHTYESVTSHTRISHVTRTNDWVMSHIWMSHVALLNESCYTCKCVMSHV